MSLNLADYILAYRAVKEERAKQAALKRFVGKDPDWKVVEYLIDKARTDVIATLTFPNGTSLSFHKRDAMDALQLMDPDRRAAF